MTGSCADPEREAERRRKISEAMRGRRPTNLEANHARMRVRTTGCRYAHADAGAEARKARTSPLRCDGPVAMDLCVVHETMLDEMRATPTGEVIQPHRPSRAAGIRTA